MILITDGENSDEKSNEKIINYFQNHPRLPIFWQFVELGSNFEFLESLVKITNNVGFFQLNDVQSVSNDILRDRLLQQFPIWYKEAKTKGIIKY